ncbi:hypothetical protein GCM10020255_005010 [Rhodococcus baikonurensis]
MLPTERRWQCVPRVETAFAHRMLTGSTADPITEHPDAHPGVGRERHLMPFVRISLLRGKSPEYLAGLQAAAHDALVEAFGMPTDDDFGIIDQYEPHELAFHRTFRISAPRSDDFVMFTITDGVDRSEPAKRRFYKLLVDLLGKRPGVRPRTSSSSSTWRHE